MFKKKENTTSKPKEDNKIGIGKFWAWNSRPVSITINTLVLGYVSFYCTDTLMLSPIVVGILLMVSRITDGITDLFAGFIVDGTNTRWGKGRPYELCVLGVWGCTLLLYCCPPSFSTVLKYVWIFVMYFFVQSIFNTLLSAGDIVYMVRAFRDEQQYAKLSSFSGIIISIAGLAFNIAFPLLMARLAVSPAGWRTLIAIFAIPCALIGMIRFFFVKEDNNVDIETKREKLKVKDVVDLLKNNHHIYPLALAIFLSTFLVNMGVGTYYYTYVIGNISLMSVGAVATVVVLPVLFIFPKLVQKFGVKPMMIIGAVVGAIGYLIQFLANTNFIVLIVGSMIAGVGMLPFSYLVSLLVIDCASFNEWQHRPRMEGTLNTVVGVAKKCGSAFGAGFSGIMLGIAGYDKTLAVMPDSAIMMIRVLMGLVPAICYIFAIICLKAYKLDKQMPQISQELKERREKAAQTMSETNQAAN